MYMYMYIYTDSLGNKLRKIYVIYMIVIYRTRIQLALTKPMGVKA